MSERVQVIYDPENSVGVGLKRTSDTIILLLVPQHHALDTKTDLIFGLVKGWMNT